MDRQGATDTTSSPAQRGWRARRIGWRVIGIAVLLVAGYLVVGHYGLS